MVYSDGKGHTTNQRFFKNQKHNFHVRKSKINCVPKQLSRWSSDSHRGCMIHERLACNYSYNSCEDLPDLFWFMFPCPYTRDFSLGCNSCDFVCDIRWFGTICSRIAVTLWGKMATHFHYFLMKWSLQHGWSEYGQLAEQRPIDFLYWLNTQPARKNDYFKM